MSDQCLQLGVVVGIVIGVAMIAGRSVLPSAFTSDATVIGIAQREWLAAKRAVGVICPFPIWRCTWCLCSHCTAAVFGGVE